MVEDEEHLIELYLWLQDALDTSSVIGARGSSEWMDRTSYICELRELLEEITRLI